MLPNAVHSRADPGASVPVPRRTPRDGRLDVWRGLCLLDMAVVHLHVYGVAFGDVGHWLVHAWFRFAAGGFIFLAGYAVAAIYVERARRDRLTAYRRLAWRALVVLGVHYACELLFLSHLTLFHLEPWANTRWAINDILLLRGGSDLLPFYVVMLALSPILVELTLRGLAVPMLLGSLGLYAWSLTGRVDPHTFGFGVQQTFVVVQWQAIFVIGFVAARLVRDGGVPAGAVAAGFGAAWIGLSLLSYGEAFGWAWARPQWFLKVPLMPLELCRYVALTGLMMALVALLWRRGLEGSPPARWAALLGRNSLVAYVAHIWLTAAAVRVFADDRPSLSRAVPALIIAVGGLTVIVWLWDRRAKLAEALVGSRPTVAAWTPRAAIAGVLLCVPMLNTIVWPVGSAAPMTVPAPTVSFDGQRFAAEPDDGDGVDDDTMPTNEPIMPNDGQPQPDDDLTPSPDLA